MRELVTTGGHVRSPGERKCRACGIVAGWKRLRDRTFWCDKHVVFHEVSTCEAAESQPAGQEDG